jgi:hypothetical protein
MRILFAISLVALAALLWASVSIAQHIYRARRRQREKNRLPVTTVAATPIKPAAKETSRQRKAS